MKIHAATAAPPKRILRMQRTRRSYWARRLRRHGICHDCAKKIAEAK